MATTTAEMHNSKTMITVESIINAPVEKVWACWTEPEHITQWCAASDDWHAPYAENDLRVDGRFVTTMAAKDGSFSFDFGGVYTEIVLLESIKYTMDDGRVCEITFVNNGKTTEVIESFEAETENPVDVQQGGWQAILNNFKNYVKSSN